MQPLTGELAATPCGHVFHQTCISEYLEFKPQCPKDRDPVNPIDLIKLFFDIKRVPAGGAQLTSTVQKALEDAMKGSMGHSAMQLSGNGPK
jgi:hypothetical protein